VPDTVSDLTRREFLSYFSGVGQKSRADDARSRDIRRAMNRMLKSVNMVESLPPIPVIALNRMGYGPSPGDFEAFAALGSDDLTRLNSYIDKQLRPKSINDSDLEFRITTEEYPTKDKTRQELWQEHYRSDDGTERRRPYEDVKRLKFLHALYSERQLFELLTEFWHDHFSVDAELTLIRSMIMHYDRDVIRPYVLSNFRLLLEAVATSTSMLYYLDNWLNKKTGPNENWARELLELHTLGQDHYFGSIPQEDVPGYPTAPEGYVEDDVFAVTRCFTGWSFNYSESEGDTGEFLYRANWHDNDEKLVLGQTFPADQDIGDPQKDGRDVLDLVASHPGTAQHISYKLCRRLIGDEPPESLVSSTAGVFLANVSAHDQITEVVRHILQSEAFRTSWNEKFKRPFEVITSAMRGLDAEVEFIYGGSWTNKFFNYFNNVGQPLFYWEPPDGYPDVGAYWRSSNSFVMRWRHLIWLVDDKAAGTPTNLTVDVVGQTPADKRTANELADYWIERLFGYEIPGAERQIVVDFMAQGEDPGADLPVDVDDSVQSRLRSMVALILSSELYQQR